MTRASNTRDSDIVSVDFEREVLESIRVADSFAWVRLGKSKDARVLGRVAVVLDDAFTDVGDVEKTVQKIGCPVEIGGAVGDVVAEHAHALERTSENV